MGSEKNDRRRAKDNPGHKTASLKGDRKRIRDRVKIKIDPDN